MIRAGNNYRSYGFVLWGGGGRVRDGDVRGGGGRGRDGDVRGIGERDDWR